MKSQKLIKVLAMALTLAMIITAFAACTKKPEEKPNQSGSANQGGSQTEAKSFTTPLVVAYDQFSEKFSPFFASTAYDQDVAGMTQLGTMTTTRTGAVVMNAIEGEDESYNNTSYHYTGTANLTVEQKGTAGVDQQTVYTIHMRDDIKFSDGQPANIDDVIFGMYVIIDPYYTGSSTLSSIDIVGLQEYIYNNSEIGSLTAEKVAEYVADIANKPELQKFVVENIITTTLTDELKWIKKDVLTDLETYGAYGITAETTAGEALYMFYGLDENYDAKAHTEQEVLDELIKEYGFGADAKTLTGQNGTYANYKALAVNYAGEAKSNYFDADVSARAKVYCAQELLASGVGQAVPNVAGFKRIDDYTLEVTTNGYAANAIYQVCSQTIAPKHYYGDNSLYDFANNKFGFENRTEEGMKRIGAKNNHPMGAGAYKFVEYKNGIVYFEANEYFYKGAPYIKNIQFKEVVNGDKLSVIKTGECDVGEVSGTVKTFEAIHEINSNGEDTGDIITSSLVWNLGYGYIGLCADNMKVGSDAGSEESKALRKGFATLLALHREANIASYYGNAAAVIEYPISSTSWAAPQISDQGYQIAYSKDVNGATIYTSDMTPDQKEAAAIEAAKGWFLKAGYTWDDAQGKFTAAPSGARLEYECWIPASGSMDHPAWGVVQNASNDLAKLGINLKLKDVAQTNELWSGLEAHTIDMWAAAWGSTIDPDMYQVYHSDSLQGSGSNHYRISDPQLDQLIVAARNSDDQTYRRSIYKQCLDIILDWGVEVPTYQRRNLICFSTERIKVDTLTPDITTYWGWMAEIETLELNNK